MITFQENGAEYIEKLIETAIENESRTATVYGNFIVDRAIRIPSNFTLILENCHLRLANGCYCNLFINEHHDTELGKTLAGRDYNISILGKGTAILDGGEYNGLSEKTHSKNGLPPIWKNNLILFTNVEGFKISGLCCRNQRWWALNFIYCAHGYIGDMDFCANDAAIDSQGNLYHGLSQDKYAEVLVKNADGIDIRQGCHDILIENITGFTEDDMVALTGLNGGLEQSFAVADLSSDICNITVKSVKGAAFCSLVRLLNQSGIKLHDILIDGVEDTSDICPHLDKGVYAVRVGDAHLYGTRQNAKEETWNITVKNVVAKGFYALYFAGEMQAVRVSGVECFNGCKMLIDKRGK